jgi:cytochrome bd ubiquinol oxidase subunit II
VTAYVWFGIAVAVLTLYVVLDGYDLGAGIISPLLRHKRDRNQVEQLIATTWDGNESWLVLGAVALYGGLPSAYALTLPLLYLPLLVLLFALIGRGISFELTADGDHPVASALFPLCSLLAAFAQGVAIGGVATGLRSGGATFTGGAFDFLTWYSVLTGFAVVALYATAGAAWLQVKAEDPLRAWAARTGRVTGVVTLALGAAVVLTFPGATAASLDWHPARVAVVVVLGVVAVLAWGVAIGAFGRRPDARAWLATVVAEVAAVGAAVATLAPVMVPPSLTVREAAGGAGSLNFLLVGVGCCLPVVAAYNIWVYRAFRGKDPQLGRGAATPTASGVTTP